jgi:hypothetical protein
MKKHFFKLTVMALLALFTTCEQGAGDSTPPSDIQEEETAFQTGIEVKSLPDITYYGKTQPFSAEGLVVVETWNDDREEQIVTGYELSFPSDLTAETITESAGAKTITIKSGQWKTTFGIMVSNSTAILQSIALVSQPSKTVYYMGEDFNKAGMKINGTYSDGEIKELTYYTINGYDKARRGTQTLLVKVNREIFTVNVQVKVPANAELEINDSGYPWLKYQPAFIKGRQLPNNGFPDNLKITVKANGAGAVLTAENGGFTIADLSSFYPNQIGHQNLTLTLDEVSISFPVYIIDVEPHVFFDYGYWRHTDSPEGGATVTGGTAAQYTVPVNTELIITPVVFSMNTETPSYTWTCTAPHTTFGAGNKYLKITPTATGTYSATVTVSAGNATGMTAATTIVCTPARTLPQPAPVVSNKFNSPLPPVMNAGNTNTGAYIRNFAPGQFTKSGTGYGWSLGAIGGYIVWKLQKAGNSNVRIIGNAFGSWNEAGIVWVSADDNHNGLPDDTWYELKGSEDEDAKYKNFVTRSYGIRFVLAAGEGYTNEYGQTVEEIYWVDSKGRTGRMAGGWSSAWGVPQTDHAWVELGATLLKDEGHICDGAIHEMVFDWGYVDSMNRNAPDSGRDADRFYISDAIRADGTPANLPYIDFVRVQSGLFYYGGVFGEISTEINWGEGLGSMTNFPSP